MFYHIDLQITGLTSWMVTNKTKEEILIEYLCPFITKDVSYHDNSLRNFSSFGGMVVYETKRPIDSDWPVSKSDFTENGRFSDYGHKTKLIETLNEMNGEITQSFLIDALELINTGKYVEGRRKYLQNYGSKFCFFICPFGNDQVDHNYEFAVKPVVEKYQFQIKRADEISHTKHITEVIIDSINKSKFLIADLTDAKPNCYYEVGYAHSQGKPVIIIASEGTQRHFDISAYKWIYYSDYKDLKLKLETEIKALIELEAHS